MRIDKSPNIHNLVNKNNNEVKDTSEVEKTEQTKTKDLSSPIVYEESSLEDKSYVYDLLSIEDLKNRSENLYQKLEKMLELMLTKQIKAQEILGPRELINILKESQELELESLIKALDKTNLLDGVKPEDVSALQNTASLKDIDNLIKLVEKIDLLEVTEDKIKELIEPGGKLGVSSVSENITSFVKLASDENLEKVEILIKLIDETFKDIEKSSQGLPHLTQKTYEKIMEKLDSSILSLSFKRKPENANLQLKTMIERVIQRQVKAYGLLESLDLLASDKSISSKEKSALGLNERLFILNSSQRVVDFIKLAAKEDKEKLNTYRNTLEKVFQDSQQLSRGLGSILEKTYDKIMEELDSWESQWASLGYGGYFVLAYIRKFYKEFMNSSVVKSKIYVVLFVLILIFFVFTRLLFR